MVRFVRAPACLLLSTYIFCQTSSIPRLVREKKAANLSDFSQEAFVIEQFHRKIKFENDGTSTVEDSARVRVQSDAGVQRYGLLTFSYPSGTNTFDIELLRVTKPDGTVIATPPDGVQDMAAEITRQAPFYSDIHEKHIAVKGLGIGDILEFQTRERTNKPLAPGQFWYEHTFTREEVLLDEQLEVSVPRSRPIKLKSSRIQPVTRDEGDSRIYLWKSSNVERKDDKAKQREALQRLVLFQRGRLPHADVLLSSFQSWDEIGHWYQVLQQERVKPTSEVRAKAAELTKSASDDRAKLQAIYDYVSTQFRYIGVAFGIGRYQPHSAADVLDNQYGDCKDKHTLLASLLDAVGIKAYPALISTEREVDPDVPTPAQFNHVITAVQSGGTQLWLDSTAEVGPFQYLTGALRDKQALVVWDDKPAAFAQTPAEPPFPSSQVFRIDAKLAEDGTLTGNVDFTARGDLEFILRSAFRSIPMPQWKDLAQRLSYNMGFGGDVSEVTASSPDKTEEPFHYSYKYTRKDFADWSDHRILSPAPSIALPLLDDDDAVLAAPVWLGAHEEMDFHSEVQIPKAYLPDLPAAIHNKHSFAEFDSTYEFKNGVLIGNRHLRTLMDEVSPADYLSYKSFRKAVIDDYGSFIPLLSGASLNARSATRLSPDTYLASVAGSIRALPDSPNSDAARLEAEARDSFAGQHASSATSSLYRAVAQDPKFTRAWVLLGTLLLASTQTDAGLEAFHNAIAIDPKRPEVYKVFGGILNATKLYSDSIPVWQDYIKLAPDDIEGPSSLGDAYFESARYPEAAAALESAVKLNPGRLSIQRELALAYLRGSDTQKTTAAFRRLLDLDPRSDMLDALAYEMAESDKQLPLALEYAQRAVRSQESDTFHLSLQMLNTDDLQLVPKLALYWDTTGWILLRMSRFEEAEKYLTASWTLSQSGLAASHLCKLYQREHQRDQAVKMCRYALNRLPMATGDESDRAAQKLPDTRAQIDLLGPEASKIDAHVVGDELRTLRSIPLPRQQEGPLTAEFFVLLKAQANSPEFKVQDVRFISGSSLLKLSTRTLASVDFKLKSPDGNAATVVRRGVLGCYVRSGCALTLLDPGMVRDLN
jgi:cytochrome c-type biogenesis protein CcmH/NrfG